MGETQKKNTEKKMMEIVKFDAFSSESRNETREQTPENHSCVFIYTFLSPCAIVVSPKTKPTTDGYANTRRIFRAEMREDGDWVST